MKSFTSVVLMSSVGLYTADAKIMACNFGFDATFLSGFAQGFQEDSYATDTDCFGETTTTDQSWKAVSSSTMNYSLDTWFLPVQRMSEFTVQLTNMWTTCKFTNFAKQMGTRTSSLSGLFDFAFTIGMAVV